MGGGAASRAAFLPLFAKASKPTDYDFYLSGVDMHHSDLFVSVCGWLAPIIGCVLGVALWSSYLTVYEAMRLLRGTQIIERRRGDCLQPRSRASLTSRAQVTPISDHPTTFTSPGPGAARERAHRTASITSNHQVAQAAQRFVLSRPK